MSAEQIKKVSENLVKNIGHKLIGKQAAIINTLTCFVAGGHLLLEDVPGLGKTTLAKGLADSFQMDFKRIQCTPDLMPNDITGVTIYNQQNHQFEFVKGPVFTNILLADEINRTSPRTQSALLEAMGEGTVTVDRKTHILPEPFFVIATQNSIEFSGTYPLPEAQMDRFMMRISLGYPDKRSEIDMIKAQQNDIEAKQMTALFTSEQLLQLTKLCEKVKLSDAIINYIADIVRATRQHPDIYLGASPRASLALMKTSRASALLAGQMFVTPTIVQALVRPVLEHRLVFKDRHIDLSGRNEFFSKLLQKVRLPDNPA